jgi:hypothetical protein
LLVYVHIRYLYICVCVRVLCTFMLFAYFMHKFLGPLLLQIAVSSE